MHIKQRHFIQTYVDIKFHNLNCLRRNANSNFDVDNNCETFIEMVNTYKYPGAFIEQNIK